MIGPVCPSGVCAASVPAGAPISTFIVSTPFLPRCMIRHDITVPGVVSRSWYNVDGSVAFNSANWSPCAAGTP